MYMEAILVNFDGEGTVMCPICGQHHTFHVSEHKVRCNHEGSDLEGEEEILLIPNLNNTPAAIKQRLKENDNFLQIIYGL